MRNKPLRALTLWPEWVWGIHYLDKRNENRGWPIPLGEWFALHAGKSIGGRPGFTAEWEGAVSLVEMARWAGWSSRLTFGGLGRWGADFWRGSEPAITLHDPGHVGAKHPIIRSAITGLIRVTEHLPPGTRGPWKAPASIGNVFDYRPLREPIPWKGAQGLWTVPEDVAARVVVNMPAMEVSDGE